MDLKGELKDLALEILAFLITAVVMVLLLIFTNLGKWTAFIIGFGSAVSIVYLLRRGKKS